MGGIFDKLKIIPIRLAILLKKEKPLYRKICLMRGPPVLVQKSLPQKWIEK